MRRLGLVLGLAALVTACAPGDPYSGMWLTRTGAQLLLHYNPCSVADKITEVSVSRAGDEGSTLWRERSSGSSQTVLPLGERAPGFSATSSVDSFPAQTKLIVTMETTERSPGGLEFRVAELKPGTALWDRGVTSAGDPYRSISRSDRGC